MKVFGMSLDSILAYTVSRNLSIRDWRLGFASLALKVGIFSYLIVGQILFQQQYRRDSAISVSVRTRERQGDAAYEWTNGSAPFCLGVTAFQHPSALLTSYYSVSPDGLFYTYSGPGASSPSTFPRRNCSYLDAAGVVPLLESDRSFLLTESRITQQSWSTLAVPCSVPPCTPCASTLLTAPSCDYLPLDNSDNPNVTTRSYIPDVEFFTINVDHSFVAPQAGLKRAGKEMSGSLLDSSGNEINPCIAYTSLGLVCPSIVKIGKKDFDILPLRALMLAAGVETLDQLSGSDAKDPQTSSMRQQGLVLILDISYTNYALGNIPNPSPGGPELGGVGTGFLLTDSEVRYTFRVYTVDRTQFQFQSASSNNDNGTPYAAVERYFKRQYGVRILINTGGRVGSFFFQTLLVNLVAGLALLGLSSTIIEYFIFSISPLRGMYRVLSTRETVDISKLREAAKAHPDKYKELVECVFLGGKEWSTPHVLFFPPCPLFAPLAHSHLPHNTLPPPFFLLCAAFSMSPPASTRSKCSICSPKVRGTARPCFAWAGVHSAR